jgi:hypothetical protein
MPQQAQGIDQQVAFAAGELFASIIAMQATSLGGFDRLTIDNGGTGRRLPSVLHSKALP